MPYQRTFMTLGMFIMDRFEYLDEDGQPTGREAEEQASGGGTYAAIGARMFLPDEQVAMIVDRGHDFQPSVQETLNSYGNRMWIFRDHQDRETTRALNLYRGEHRGFEYLTPRLRITPKDYTDEQRGRYLHFICSPKRAKEIMSQVGGIPEWDPVTIFEPIPDRCVPSELPALRDILQVIHILSPNASEACNLLSIQYQDEPDKETVERAADILYSFGIGPRGQGAVVIRSGASGAYVKDSQSKGKWVDAYYTAIDAGRVVDVTGAGNAFLGGLAAGLSLCEDDIYIATVYGTVAASFVIEQHGLPSLMNNRWNDGDPVERVQEVVARQQQK
ncbi:hypothetical protein FRC17_005029 [Serendipita sp. 399]|nr:hypothetical protein FRC17_005029 [Serendipita sp. 399]